VAGMEVACALRAEVVRRPARDAAAYVHQRRVAHATQAGA
jgi:hypothetical protein